MKKEIYKILETLCKEYKENEECFEYADLDKDIYIYAKKTMFDTAYKQLVNVLNHDNE